MAIDAHCAGFDQFLAGAFRSHSRLGQGFLDSTTARRIGELVRNPLASLDFFALALPGMGPAAVAGSGGSAGRPRPFAIIIACPHVALGSIGCARAAVHTMMVSLRRSWSGKSALGKSESGTGVPPVRGCTGRDAYATEL